MIPSTRYHVVQQALTRVPRGRAAITVRALLLALFLALPAVLQPRPLAAQVDSAVDQPDFWLQEFERHEAIYQSIWGRPVDGPHEAYARSDGSIVAWVDTRYALAAYLDMYHWSKDRRYLDLFVARMNMLLPYRRDVDGNGTYSWATAKYWDSLVRKGDFETTPVEWRDLSSAQVLTTTATTEYLVVPHPDGKCAANLPNTFLDEYYVQLAPGESISQAYLSPGTSYYFRLRLDVNVPPGDRLAVTLDGEDGRVLAADLERVAVSGPEGWQRYAQDFTVNVAGAMTLTIKATGGNAGPVALDNILLTPYLDMFTGDMQMAAVLAYFSLLVHEHPELVAYKQETTRYQRLAEDVIANYQHNWRELDAQRGTYMISDVEPYSHPYNHVAPAGEALLMLSMLNEGEKAAGYLRQAEMLARTMRSQMWENLRVPDALSWNYMDSLLEPRPDFIPRVEDVVHAGNSVPFLALMQQAGRVITDDDVRKVGNALAALWNGSYADAQFYNFLDIRSDLAPLGQFPYMRHVILTAHTRLQEASIASWLSRARKLQCIADAETMSNGWVMSMPAALLRYRYPSTDTATIKVVVKGAAGEPALLAFAGDLGEFTVEKEARSGAWMREFRTAPGAYRIEQVLPQVGMTNDVHCTLTGGAATQTDGRGARVVIEAGEDVTCTFQDTYTQGQVYLPLVKG